MKLLEDRILKDGEAVDESVLRVGSFLNQQIDIDLMQKCAEEIYSLYKDEGVNKILTIEASGIGFACVTALLFHCPVVFAKKHRSSNVSGDTYTTTVTSFTHGSTFEACVSKEYIKPTDRILLLDDFLATGNALEALLDLCNQAKATVVGSCVLVEEEYQGGGNELRKKGLRVESLARISAMSKGHIEFC